MKFKDILKQKRLELGMTQGELAKAAGMTTRTIQYYEIGDRRPRNYEVVDKLASALGISPRELLGTADQYVVDAGEKGGANAAKDMDELVNGVIGLFAGGEMDEEAMDGVYRALSEAYWEAKDRNKKYTPKKYRKDSED